MLGLFASFVNSNSDKAINSSSVAGPSPTAVAGVLLTLAPGVPGVVGTKLTPGLPPTAPGCTVGGVRVQALATVEVGTGAGVGLPLRDGGRAGNASFDLGVVVVVEEPATKVDNVDPGFVVVVEAPVTCSTDLAVVGVTDVGTADTLAVVTVAGFTVVPDLAVVEEGATVVVEVLSFLPPNKPPKKPCFFVVGVAGVVVVVVVVVVDFSSLLEPPPNSLPKKPFFVVVDGMGVVLVGAATVEEGVTLGSTGAYDRSATLGSSSCFFLLLPNHCASMVTAKHSKTTVPTYSVLMLLSLRISLRFGSQNPGANQRSASG